MSVPISAIIGIPIYASSRFVNQCRTPCFLTVLPFFGSSLTVVELLCCKASSASGVEETEVKTILRDPNGLQ